MDISFWCKIKLIFGNIIPFLQIMSYISTSIWEGSSLAMIDAAFMGLPILCSNCPTGRKEFIKDNKRGYIFKTNNFENLKG